MDTMPALLTYAASGYTGCIASHHARDLGINFVAAGRAGSSTVEEMARSLGVEHRLFDVKDSVHIGKALDGVSVLLNCAGPFMDTAEPLMETCIRTGVHYLDISAELDSYELTEKNDYKARDAGVMLLPGCGGIVTMLGNLAGKAIMQVENPSHIDVCLRVSALYPVDQPSAHPRI